YVDDAVAVNYLHGLDLISQERDGSESFYLVDGLGSTRILTDEGGEVTNTYSYDAFGNIISSGGTIENDYRFAGEQYDENLDQYYLRQRSYDAGIGRFTRRDTYEGRLGNPVTLHKYLYANGNPVNYVDPTGLYTLAEVQTANSIRDILNNLQIENGQRLIQATLNGGNSGVEDLLLDFGITLAVTLAPYALPYVASGISSGLSAIQKRIDARALANSVEELRLTGTVANHLSDFTIRTDIVGGRFTELDRPFINSPLVYQEIMKAKTPVPDPRGVPGALRWDVEGSFRGREGIWELVVDPKTKTVLHFNFVGRRR
ncbi:RHS repeat-associated core domain-containing protein, partial [Laspinema olomoucense]